MLDDVVSHVRTDFEHEAGAFRLRRSAQLFAAWVTEAGGVVKGEPDAAGADEESIIVPLWLYERSNCQQNGTAPRSNVSLAPLRR